MRACVRACRHRGGVQASLLRPGAKRPEFRGHEEGGVRGAAEAFHSEPLVLRPGE